MAMSSWLQNGTGKNHMLVDMGCLDKQETRDNADKLLDAIKAAGHKGRCGEIVGNRRLVIRIPPKVKNVVIASCPEISEGSADYCWCTHGWRSNV